MANYHHYKTAGALKTDQGTQTFDSLTADLTALSTAGNAKGITGAKPEVIGKSAVGKHDILALKIGKDPKVRVVFVGCHHAREWISVEVPFLAGKYLIDNYDKAATTAKAKSIRYLVDNAEIWVVPMLNVDGHLKTFTAGQLSWRPNIHPVAFSKDKDIERWVETAPFHKKPHPTIPDVEIQFHRLQPKGTGTKHIHTVKKGTYEGVDLNRNYPVPAGKAGSKSPAWGVETCGVTVAHPGGLLRFFKTSVAPPTFITELWDLTTAQSPDPPDTFCGPSAGSEPEVDAIVKLVAKGNFKCLVSYHNFGQLILFPDDAATDADVQFLGKGFDELFKFRGAAYTYESGSALYPTSGDTMEWAYRVHTLPNYTIEVSPTEADAEKTNGRSTGCRPRRSFPRLKTICPRRSRRSTARSAG